MKIEKVSVIGCGALGIMYASHMLKSFSQNGILFIADQKRIEKYQKAEFYANGERQSFHFVGPDSVDAPSDLVIFAVKYNQLRDAVKIAKNHIGEHTIIISLLNGISSEEILGETYNPKKILCSVAIGMDATKNGYAVHFTQMGRIALGGLHKESVADVHSVADFFDKVGIKYEIQDDILKTMWWKYILNVGMNQTSALLKSSYGLFQTSAYAENLMRMAMVEAYEIARKVGININDEDIERCVATMKTLSSDGKTSMCQDIEAQRYTEVDMFAGTLMELGKQYGVPVPVNTFLFNGIKALESRF